MINESTQKSIIYIFAVVGHLLLATLIFDNFLNSESEYIIQANEVDNSTEAIVDVNLLEAGHASGQEVASLTPLDIAHYIVDRFGYNEVGQIALEIAKCESGLDPNATNEDNWLWGTKGVDRGIFQINDYYHRDKFDNIEQLYDPKFNIDLAKEIYDSSGWYAWSCYKSGGYLE